MKAKPKPPVDLWQQLRDDLGEMGHESFKLTPNTFTVIQFCEQCNLSSNQAYARLRKLVATGRVRKLGRKGMTFYYERVMD